MNHRRESQMADVNAALDKLMADAINTSQRMVGLMTQSCSGGEHGVNPAHYGEFVESSNQVQKVLVDLRLELAKGPVADAGKQIDVIENTLEQMVAMMHQTCQGGQNGLDPLHYGDLINIKQRVLGSLDAVKAILA